MQRVDVEDVAQLERTEALSRLGPATRSLRGLSDAEVLVAGRRERVAENHANGQRWLCFVEFYRRRLDGEKLQDTSAHFTLTALQETKVEIGELWGMDASRVAKELGVALFLVEHADEVWGMCLRGELDGYRATLVADAARRLAPGVERRRFVSRMTAFLLRRRRGVDGAPDELPLVTCTSRQLRNAIAYQQRLVRPAAEDEQFRVNYAGRRSYVVESAPGMGSLTLENSIDRVKLAQHRLTMAARKLREQGDERTLRQLRTDLALDLLIGDRAAASVPAVPGYARPIINVTVPAQTLMGLADQPGIAAGGGVIPASLARMIATQPGATWHRMLIDDAGRMVALSTKSYRPTKAVWAHVVAENPTCFRSGCDASATEGDLDHRVAWPLGATDTANLWPGCRTDHRVKHAPGFRIEQTDDGAFVLRTRAGLRHPIEPATHPVSEDWSAPDLEDSSDFQFSATEFLDAISHLRALDHQRHLPTAEELWEEGDDDVLTPSEWRAMNAGAA